jgi:hypothetical protein
MPAMKIEIDTHLEGLGDVLSNLLPAGAEPTSLMISPTRLRLDARVPLAGKVVLTATVESSAGRVRLHDFDIAGASLFRKTVLRALQEKIEGVDERAGPFRARGEDGGASLVVTWG